MPNPYTDDTESLVYDANIVTVVVSFSLLSAVFCGVGARLHRRLRIMTIALKKNRGPALFRMQVASNKVCMQVASMVCMQVASNKVATCIPCWMYRRVCKAHAHNKNVCACFDRWPLRRLCARCALQYEPLSSCGGPSLDESTFPPG